MPLVRRVVALALHAIEDDRLAVARHLDMRRVERAELEQILAAVVVGALLQIVEQRRSRSVTTAGFDASRA